MSAGPTLEQYRRGRVTLARFIAARALETIYENNAIALSILRANLKSQGKIGKVSEAFPKSILKRKDVENVLRSIAVLGQCKGSYYINHTWNWHQQEIEDLIQSLRKSQDLFQDSMEIKISDNILEFIVERLKLVPNKGEVCSLIYASNCDQPEFLLLTFLRCLIFVWKEDRRLILN